MSRRLRLLGIAACVFAVAGGAGLWVYYPAPKPALSAAALPHPTASSPRSLRSPSTIPAADRLLAGLPPPGQGYAIETDEHVLGAIRTLLARSPDAALAWARQCSNPGWRPLLLALVYSTWAATDPSAAIASAGNEAPADADLDFAAVLTGAVAHPDIALSLGLDLLAAQPDRAGDFGAVLVGAFIRAGQFSDAITLANSAPDNLRGDWLAATFKAWSQQQPEQAAQALGSVADPVLYEQLFQSLTTGWASTNPSQLANYALTLPPGDDRSYALNQVFSQWSLQDPAGLATWLVGHQATQDETDAAAAAIIQRTDQANRDTPTALQWAESINDPSLRFTSVSHVVKEWAAFSPTDAQNYVYNAAWLDAQQRSQMLQNSNLNP